MEMLCPCTRHKSVGTFAISRDPAPETFYSGSRWVVSSTVSSENVLKTFDCDSLASSINCSIS